MITLLVVCGTILGVCVASSFALILFELAADIYKSFK